MKLGCADLSKALGQQPPYCSFVAKGKTKEEVKAKLMQHAADDHKDLMANLPKEQLDMSMKMMDQLVAKLK
jgi:predicted small metal-binding protein